MTSKSSDATGQSAASSPLRWDHAVLDIPKDGLSVDKSASPQECAAVQSALSGQPPGLASISDFAVRYRIDRLAGGGYRLKGRLGANVVQSCIVSLEPIATRAEDTFDVEFWTEVKAADDGRNEIGVFEAPEVETIEHGVIDAGRIVFETLSAGLDPYPRRSDAHFEWTDPALEAPEKASPFSVLSRLKDKQ